jgi:two-component system, sensor histidine kinase and response regulator
MRIQRTSQIITAAVIALSVLSVASALVARQYRIQQKQAYERRLSALTFADQLALGSDRLTTAVRVYAATGNHRRYKLLQGVPK